MGSKDSVTKEYMRNPVIFADVFNKYLYHGAKIIRPENLKEVDTAEAVIPYGTDDKSGSTHRKVTVQKYRDILKLVMTDGNVAYCILGIENQSEIHYAAPVKNGLYDFMQYARQVTETAQRHRRNKEAYKQTSGEYLSGFYKKDKLLPIITVIVYFGTDEWDGPFSLRDMYSTTDENVMRYAPDYRINLIAPYQMSYKEMTEFRTDFREVMIFHKYAKDKNRLREAMQKDENFKHLSRKTVEVINVTANACLQCEEGKEEADVCEAIKQIKEEGKIEAFYEMGLSIDKIAKKVGVTTEIVTEVINKIAVNS